MLIINNFPYNKKEFSEMKERIKDPDEKAKTTKGALER